MNCQFNVAKYCLGVCVLVCLAQSYFRVRYDERFRISEVDWNRCVRRRTLVWGKKVRSYTQPVHNEMKLLIFSNSFWHSFMCIWCAYGEYHVWSLFLAFEVCVCTLSFKNDKNYLAFHFYVHAESVPFRFGISLDAHLFVIFYFIFRN